VVVYYYHHRFYDQSGEDGARGEASLVVDGLEQRLLFGDGEDLWTMVGELAKQLCGGEREARRVKIYARGRERGSRLYRKEASGFGSLHFQPTVKTVLCLLWRFYESFMHNK